jgi:hypothetical protein
MATGTVVMETATGVKVTVIVEVLEVSVLLVAVIVADAVATGVGAVYTPAELIAPTEADQLTPALAESFETVAAKVWVAPATMATGTVVMATLIAGAAGEPPHPTIKASAAILASIHEDSRMFAIENSISPKKLGNRRIENQSLLNPAQLYCKKMRASIVIKIYFYWRWGWGCTS